jgi:hypothetical protein
MDDARSLSHTVWNCKCHVVWIRKYRRKVVYGELRRHLRWEWVGPSDSADIDAVSSQK